MSAFAQLLLRLLQQPVSVTLAGVLLGVATALPHLFLLAVLALLPFFAIVDHPSYRIRARHAFLFGFAFFGTVYWWFWGVYPLKWIGIANDGISFALLAFAWVMTASVLGYTMVLRVAVIRRLSQQLAFLSLGIAAVVWVLFEWVAALTFSLLWAGAQSTLGAHWTFGFLGYAAAEVPILRSLASIGGIYMLSFAVIIAAAIVYSMMRAVAQRKKLFSLHTMYLYWVATLLVCASILGYALAVQAPSGTEKQVVLIHTNFPSKLEQLTDTDRAYRSQTILSATERVVLGGLVPDIVVFPESSEVLNHASSSDVQRLFSLLQGSTNTLFINPTNNIQNGDELISSVIYIRSHEGIIDIRNKSFLVSVGEYAPYIGVFLTHIAGASEWFDTIYATHGYHRVNDDMTQFKDTEVATLQCSEIISPYLYRRLAENHAIFANAASHAAFTNGRMIREQTLKMARIHAVANDRFFLQAGNIAPAFVLTNLGAVQDYVYTDAQVDTLVSTAHVRSTQTPYTRWGDWFMVLLLLCAFACVVYGGTKR